MAFSTYFEIFVLIVAAIVLCCESAQEKVKIPAFDSTIRPAKCADGWRGEACEIPNVKVLEELQKKYDF